MDPFSMVVGVSDAVWIPEPPSVCMLILFMNLFPAITVVTSANVYIVIVLKSFEPSLVGLEGSLGRSALQQRLNLPSAAPSNTYLRKFNLKTFQLKV